MIILWDNLIISSVLTPSSETISKPIDNLKDPTLSSYFEFIGNSGFVVIDLNQAELISDFMLPGTNITDGYSTIKLEGNDSDSWGGPAYSVNLELYINGAIGIKDINQTFRYWRIVVEDLNLTNLYLGYCFIGGRLQMPGIDPAVKLRYNQKTKRSFSVSQQLYSDTGVDFFSTNFDFPIITEDVTQINGIDIATREDILEFWYYNKGAIPFILIIWDNDRDRVPPLVGVINQDYLEFPFDRTQGYYSLSFPFVETK